MKVLSFFAPRLSETVIEPTLWEQLAAWLHDFFNPELSGYANFDLGSDGLVNIRIIVFGMFAGVMVAALYMAYIKNVVGAFVRKLLARECFDEARAQTLSELGFLRNPFVRHALRGSVLASTVRTVPIEQGSEAAAAAGHAQGGEVEKASAEKAKKGRPDLTKLRYYIREERKYAAAMRFNVRGSGWPTLLFVLLIAVMCVFIIFALLPEILQLVDTTLGAIRGTGNILK